MLDRSEPHDLVPSRRSNHQAAAFVQVHGLPLDDRPAAFGALSAAWVVPGLVGPALAGVVTQRIAEDELIAAMSFETVRERNRIVGELSRLTTELKL